MVYKMQWTTEESTAFQEESGFVETQIVTLFKHYIDIPTAK